MKSKRERARGAPRTPPQKQGANTRRAQVNAIAAAAEARRARPPRGNGEAPVAGRSNPRPQLATPNARESQRMPPEIRRRFIATRDLYYFPGGARAFVDGGDWLTTRSEQREVIQSLAAIAQARGWQQVSLSGTRRFQRQMWLAARLAGLTVRGYQPDAHTQAQFDRERSRAARRMPPAPQQLPLTETVTDSTQQTRPSSPSRPAQPPREWRGRLIEQGAAPYRHQLANGASYFVKLETREGEREIWGIDLKRAMSASLSHPVPGDEVVLRRVGRETVTVRAAGTGAQDESLKAPRRVQRNRFVIETRAFLQARGAQARVVRDDSVSAHAATQRYPDLAATYLTLRLAQLAAQRLPREEDQRRFVHWVRSGVADALARGEPIRAIGLRARDARRTGDPERPRRAAELLRG